MIMHHIISTIEINLWKLKLKIFTKQYLNEYINFSTELKKGGVDTFVSNLINFWPDKNFKNIFSLQ